MARLVLFFIAFIVPCVAECGGFRIRGDVGGLSGSTKVLVCYDIDIPVSYGFDYAVAGNQPLAEAPVNDGKFVISGHVDSPALAYIIFCDAQASSFMDDTEARYVTLMLDNADVDVCVVDVKKLPRVMNFDEPEVSPMMSETAAVISGGDVQNGYNEWRAAVREAEDRVWHTESLLGTTGHVMSNDAMERPQHEKDSLMAVVAEQRREVERINDSFMNAHPEYAISLVLQLKKLEQPYCYTKEDLEYAADRFACNADTLRYNRFVADMPRYAKFAKGNHFADLRMVSADGEETGLAAVLSRDKINVVDFWASWCGPCRAAVPELRRINDRYEGRINMIGVSLDTDDGKWQSALDSLMSWRQFRVRKEDAGPVSLEYGITAIPAYFVISASGEILGRCSDVAELSRMLGKNIND